MNLSHNRRQGFALVELVVIVVGFVGLLGLWALFGQRIVDQAKEKARRAQCMNNLYQIGITCALYAGDNNNRIPCGTRSVFLNAALMSKYQHFFPKCLVCPSMYAKYKQPVYDFGDTNATDAANVSYTQQASSTANGMVWGIDPKDVLFWDQGVAGNPCGPNGGVGLRWATTGNHRDDGGNVLFNDGHVAWQIKTPTNMTLGCLNP